MGGIFGAYSRSRPVAPLIRMGLERLVHRGVDGAGIATMHNGKIFVKKDVGKVTDVHKKVNLDDLPGYVGIGHVRSATHGRPAYENTHPVQDCKGELALVMDGVVAGYDELRRVLIKKHNLSSRTDAEALAHMVEDELSGGLNIVEAIAKVARRVRGYFTFALLKAGDENIYAVSMGNPLVIGVGEGEYFISSEEQALVDRVSSVYYLEPGMMAIVGPGGVKILDVETLREVGQRPRGITRYQYEIVKGAFSHYMVKEIYEEPEALARSINLLQREYVNDAANLVSKARSIIMTGSGTSYHALLIGKYYLESIAGVRVEAIPAGEFIYSGLRLVEPGTLIIALSQSGESVDIIRAVRMAKRRGGVILGIVNRLGSTLMRESNVYLPMGAGPEMAVPATKTFVASLSILLQLASSVVGKLDEARAMLSEAVGKLMNQLDDLREQARKVSRRVSGSQNAYVISGGPWGLPMAMEASLKLKEAAQIYAEALNFREFKHGPITLVSEGLPTVAIFPGGDIDDEVLNVASEVWARGGLVISIARRDFKASGDYVISIEPTSSEYTMPIIYASAIQLLAYEAGVAKGVDVDNPRNLSKVVTT